MRLPPRFLLIDDDPFNNTLCKRILHKIYTKPEVITFTEPENGLKYIQEEYSKEPLSTVIFLDINMPTLSGWEVLDKIEQFPESVKKHLTIFILSSSINFQDKKRASENPLVTYYLEKPLTKTVLASIFTEET